MDCKLVLTTSMRLDEEKKNFVLHCLESSGISKDRVIGLTPKLDAGGRGAEINSWLSSNPWA